MRGVLRARTADLVLSISDVEADEIERTSGRHVIYLPAVSDLASSRISVRPFSRFTAETNATACRYAALMGSAYWPNVEGFFSIFPEGLGFLAQNEQIWIAGALGSAVQEDERFQNFISINEKRTRIIGYLNESEKSEFFSAAHCVIVPVEFGAGSKLKTADAIASGLPVISTRHAIDGYGPIVRDALNRGVYIADEPATFRRLVREALRNGLPGCASSVRAELSLETMSKNWAQHINHLLVPGIA
ncbi:glycosyltransferase [Acidiphilium acidophilum]|uniref:Glycosyltransferase n=1 Tax=Acidiphilium acidophilum TaxID=76588 RepID=A0AAW9DKN3_ACIAO|nr:glycosyltransferase [Acidiphilium acidophilum]MDX5929546.1 glycosyltransferase [Acidiphilium acidophilum]